MKEEKKVKELVTSLSDFPHLPYWATLKEALIQLNSALEDGINTVLVFNEAYRLIGVLTQAGILRGIEPKFAHHYEKGKPVSWSDFLAGSARKRMLEPIKNFMSPAKVTIDAEDGILKASHIMLTEQQQILAVQEQGKIIGVINLDDVFREIIEFLLDID